MVITLYRVALLQQEVLDLVNALRLSRGLGILRLSGTLNHCAAKHTMDQIENIGEISHFGSDNSNLHTRLKRIHYDLRRASENVASGQKNADHLVRSLMDSEGHRRNIMDPRVDEMGLFVKEDSYGRKYWTQVFGKRKSRNNSFCDWDF